MTKDIDKRWGQMIRKSEKIFGAEMDLPAFLFLIGVQELGKGFCKLTRDEKMDIMHIATCKLLERHGYYKLIRIDKEGWPHWKRIKKLPALDSAEQTKLMKMAILDYFEEKNPVPCVN